MKQYRTQTLILAHPKKTRSSINMKIHIKTDFANVCRKKNNEIKQEFGKLAFSGSNLTTETLEQGVKYVQS